ncbi:MAG: hypothetical protein ACRDQI_06475 [Pseudonocardiaceae bacterium]
MVIDYDSLGPQALQVEALIRRCEAMSPQQVELLACRWSVVLRDKDDYEDIRIPKATLRESERLFQARGRARGAAWRASGDRDTSGTSAVILAATDLARRAARHGSVQTQAAAAHGAKDAVIALVARDRISGSGAWGWEQYDLLTAPWRVAIGRIHPDDAGIRG